MLCQEKTQVLNCGSSVQGFVDAKNSGQLKIFKSQIKAASSLASTTVFTVKDGAVSQQGDPGFANSFTNLMHRCHSKVSKAICSTVQLCSHDLHLTPL